MNNKNKKAKELFLKLIKIFLLYFFIVTAIATQYLAYKVKYNKALGGIRIIKTNHKIYFPLAYPFWEKQYGKSNPKIFKHINNYYYGSFFIFLIIAVFVLKKKNEVTVHGTARWATQKEMKKMNLYQPTGVVLGLDPNGKIMHDNSDKHVFMEAPTRGGKGINTVNPTAYDWINSVVFNDIKGELWEKTSGYRKNVLGQKVFMFCPVDNEGISCQYNPLDGIAIGTLFETEDISVVTQTLIDTEGKGESDHWISSAMNLLNGVIMHIKYAIPGASLVDVANFIMPSDISFVDVVADILGVPREDEADETGVAVRAGDSDEDIDTDEKGEMIYPSKGYAAFDHLKHFEDKELFKKIYNYKGSKTDVECKLHPTVAKEFMSFLSTPDKERGSILSTAQQKLKIFLDPLIAKHIRKSDFTIKQLMDEKCSLYLVTPPRSISRTKPLLRLIFTQIVYGLTDRMKFNMKSKKDKSFFEKIKEIFNKYGEKIKDFFYTTSSKEKNSLLLLIDEFASLEKLGIIEQSMNYIAGYRIKCLLIAQSLKQFRKIYGKDNNILDNCSIQIHLTPNDEDTPKMISDMFDTYTEKIVTHSSKGFELMPTRTTSYVPRKLMTAGEVRTLPYEEILVMMTGQNPIKGKKLFYYLDKRYMNKELPPPKTSDFNEELENKHLPKEWTVIEKEKQENMEESILKLTELMNNADKNNYEDLAIKRTNYFVKNFVLKDTKKKNRNKHNVFEEGVDEIKNIVKELEENEFDELYS